MPQQPPAAHQSIDLVPLWLAELARAVQEREGFLAFYVRNGALKVVAPDGAGEVDAVLGRLLEGFTRLGAEHARPIGAADSVLTALAHLQAQIDAVQPHALTAPELYSLLEAEEGIHLSLTNHDTVLISTAPSAQQNLYVENGYVSSGYVL